MIPKQNPKQNNQQNSTQNKTQPKTKLNSKQNSTQNKTQLNPKQNSTQNKTQHKNQLKMVDILVFGTNVSHSLKNIKRNMGIATSRIYMKNAPNLDFGSDTNAAPLKRQGYRRNVSTLLKELGSYGHL